MTDAPHKPVVVLRGWPYYGWDVKPDIYAVAQRFEDRASRAEEKVTQAAQRKKRAS